MIRTYEDAGVSGAKSSRPAFDQMMQDAARRKAGGTSSGQDEATRLDKNGGPRAWSGAYEHIESWPPMCREWWRRTHGITWSPATEKKLKLKDWVQDHPEPVERLEHPDFKGAEKPQRPTTERQVA